MKKDIFLRLFFKPSEIKKIKKVDKMHAKKVVSLKKVERYIMNFRMMSYFLITLFTVLLVLLSYIMYKYKIFLQSSIFNNLPLLFARVLPVYFLILIIVELFIIYNRVYEVFGTIFNKEIKNCFIWALFHLCLMILSIILIVVVYKKISYIKTDILILMLGVFYFIKSLMDIIGFARMYLKSKLV